LKVQVDLKGRFKELFSDGELDLELAEGANVKDLLRELCERNRNATEVFYNRNAALKPNVSITKNGRFIIHLNWLDTTLDEGDQVTIFTLHCGG
jgi:sulfur-carrier protein